MLDLHELADFSIKFAIEALKSGRGLYVMATVFDQEWQFNFLVDDGKVQQEQFVLAVRQMVKDFNAQAVCLLADSYVTKVTSPEVSHRIANGESFTAAEILARKWGRRREAIICTVERPGSLAVFHQFYRRNSEGSIIVEELQIGNPDLDSLGATHRTGLYRFFEQPAPTVQ